MSRRFIFFPHMNLKEKVGKSVDFYAFSNLDCAELFINGKSCGLAYNKKDLRRSVPASCED